MTSLPRAARLPPPVGPGDRVGVAALSGPVDPERLERGLSALRGMGFEPVVAANALSRHGLFAGGDVERLAGFHRLAADRDIAAIFFARGGHGVLRVLPGIDWELLGRRPRAYVGYSDLTPLLLGVVQRLGLVAFHGPMVAADLARGMPTEDAASLLGALAGRYPVSQPLGPAVRLGGASGAPAGPLLGGCLSLLAATLGTPYFPDLAGSLLFWEDVGEPPYRIDRMLTHLRLSGTLAGLQGMIVGHLNGGETAPAAMTPVTSATPVIPTIGPCDDLRAAVRDASFRAVVADALAGLAWPIAWGQPSGHRPPNRTLPLGLPARLSAGAAELVLG
jgi:muramoyltetrapeptide carboxypeptidase